MITIDEAIKQNADRLKNFLIENKYFLDNKKFKALYDELGNYKLATNMLTALLLKADINPLNYMEEVPNYFASNLDIKEIIIPDNIKIIGMYAFDGCSNLESLYLSRNLNYIGPGAFGYCDLLKDLYCGFSEDYFYENVVFSKGNDDLMFKPKYHFNTGGIK